MTDPITPRTPFLPILQAIADDYGVTLEEVRGRGRRQDRVRARWHVMHYLRTVRHWSYPRIGQYLDGRDHATVIHGVREHERLHAKPECDLVALGSDKPE